MHCSSCGHQNPTLARFCAECGGPRAHRCARCQTELPSTAKFCLECGTPVAPGASVPQTPASPERPPDPLLGKEGEPEPELEPVGERRQLTVLLVRSTSLAPQLNPEDWRDVLAPYHTAAAQAVRRWGGHVAKHLGDGLLVYFGWPSAREDDPERAIRAGLSIVEAVRLLEEESASAAPPTASILTAHTLSVRVGLGGDALGKVLFQHLGDARVKLLARGRPRRSASRNTLSAEASAPSPPWTFASRSAGVSSAANASPCFTSVITGWKGKSQGQHFYDAELHRLQAEILLDQNGNAVEEAEALFGQSLEIARRQSARSFELRAAMSLARLWQRQRKSDAAGALLGPIYEWFSEGFGTRDLIQAKAQLEELMLA